VFWTGFCTSGTSYCHSWGSSADSCDKLYRDNTTKATLTLYVQCTDTRQFSPSDGHVTTRIASKLRLTIVHYLHKDLMGYQQKWKSSEMGVMVGLGSMLGRSTFMYPSKSFTHMCLCSPSSIIWYRPNGGDKVNVGLASHHRLKWYNPLRAQWPTTGRWATRLWSSLDYGFFALPYLTGPQNAGFSYDSFTNLWPHTQQPTVLRHFILPVAWDNTMIPWRVIMRSSLTLAGRTALCIQSVRQSNERL